MFISTKGFKERISVCCLFSHPAISNLRNSDKNNGAASLKVETYLIPIHNSAHCVWHFIIGNGAPPLFSFLVRFLGIIHCRILDKNQKKQYGIIFPWNRSFHIVNILRFSSFCYLKTGKVIIFTRTPSYKWKYKCKV